jgi:hypothetical protein
MVEKSDRKELERRFEQAKRMVVQSGDAAASVVSVSARPSANHLTLARSSLGTNRLFQAISSDQLAPLRADGPYRKRDIRMS